MPAGSFVLYAFYAAVSASQNYARIWIALPCGPFST
ncbi:Uncharacterised protein [uncultured Clostridium sp.]|nr:Uncharacterised protein [uncultured Clostridium sp.]